MARRAHSRLFISGAAGLVVLAVLAALVAGGFSGEGAPQGAPPASFQLVAQTVPGDTGADEGLTWSRVLGWLAVALALVVGYRALTLYLAIGRNFQLVVSDFSNSSGVSALDGAAPGLSLLARQYLVDEMRHLRRRARQLAGPASVPLYKDAPLPSRLPNTSLGNLTTALSGSVPDPAKPAVQLLGLLAAPRGTMADGRLQMRGDAPGISGISVETQDLRGVAEPQSVTFWEVRPPGLPYEGPEPEPSPRGEEQPHSRDSRALYVLGILYRSKGALEQARTSFEEAAKKDPNNAAAWEALREVLGQERRTPSGRYGALLAPVCRWLAAEFSRDRMLAGVGRAIDAERRLERRPFGKKRHNLVRRARAQVHNFVGAYHMLGDHRHGTFLRSAEREFRRAVFEDPDWYLPRDNLGDALSYAGRQLEAIDSYDAALKTLERTPPEDASTNELLAAGQRILLARGIARLRSDDNSLVNRAVAEIGDLGNDIVDRPVQEPHLLYNLACWYAVAARKGIGPGDAVERARRYLAGALARDRSGGLRAWAERDPDLEAVRGDLDAIRSAVEAMLAANRSLPDARGAGFWAQIDAALSEAG